MIIKCIYKVFSLSNENLNYIKTDAINIYQSQFNIEDFIMNLALESFYSPLNHYIKPYEFSITHFKYNPFENTDNLILSNIKYAEYEDEIVFEFNPELYLSLITKNHPQNRYYLYNINDYNQLVFDSEILLDCTPNTLTFDIYKLYYISNNTIIKIGYE